MSRRNHILDIKHVWIWCSIYVFLFIYYISVCVHIYFFDVCDHLNTINLLEFLSIPSSQIICDIGEQATIYCPLYLCIYSFLYYFGVQMILNYLLINGWLIASLANWIAVMDRVSHWPITRRGNSHWWKLLNEEWSAVGFALTRSNNHDIVKSSVNIQVSI